LGFSGGDCALPPRYSTSACVQCACTSGRWRREGGREEGERDRKTKRKGDRQTDREAERERESETSQQA